MKRFIADNGKKVPGADSQAQGGGEIDLNRLATKTPASYTQNFSPAKGGGTLEAARGSDHLSRDGVVLSGEVDIFGNPLKTKELALAEAAGNTWSGGSWNGNTWSGNTWSGNTWSRQHLERQHLVRQHLERQHLERQHLERQHLVGQHLERHLAGAATRGAAAPGRAAPGASEKRATGR